VLSLSCRIRTQSCCRWMCFRRRCARSAPRRPTRAWSPDSATGHGPGRSGVRILQPDTSMEPSFRYRRWAWARGVRCRLQHRLPPELHQHCRRCMALACRCAAASPVTEAIAATCSASTRTRICCRPDYLLVGCACALVWCAGMQCRLPPPKPSPDPTSSRDFPYFCDMRDEAQCF
jgi:hypothetical protein